MPYDPKTLKNVATHLPSWASEPTPEALNALRENRPLVQPVDPITRLPEGMRLDDFVAQWKAKWQR